MALNPYTGTYSTAPALVRLEDEVLRWFATIVGYPDDAGGFLTTGSSLAVLSRGDRGAGAGGDAPWDRARIYVGDQTHHCLGKALFAAGFRPENLVVLPARDYRLDPAQLADAIAADRARGLVPVLVVGSAGTTNTGRVDPLAAIADVCAAHGAWFHCDAAYGGFFRLLTETDDLLRGMERADSISLDPHKSLAMPYGTGALLGAARRRPALPARPRRLLHAAPGRRRPAPRVRGDRPRAVARLPRPARLARPAALRPRAVPREPAREVAARALARRRAGDACPRSRS